MAILCQRVLRDALVSLSQVASSFRWLRATVLQARGLWLEENQKCKAIDFILGIILHLRRTISIDIIIFSLIVIWSKKKLPTSSQLNFGSWLLTHGLV